MEEKKVDPNAWALTYGDMITLLMTFFVLIISMSTIDTSKIVDAINNQTGLGDNIITAELTESGMFEEKVKSKATKLAVDEDKYPPPVSNMDVINNEMVVFMTENELYEVIDLKKTKEGFMIRIRADILFDPGEAELKIDNLYLLDKIAKLLSVIPNDIRIDGHTDDQYSDDYDTDNKLSIARATRVCRYLIEEESLMSARFGIAGYGRHRPIRPNNSEENRSKNRRVEVIIKEISKDA